MIENDSFETLNDPLSVAVAARDRMALDLVRRGLEDNRVMLAYQPIVQAGSHATVFYEGLIRVMDETGRIIPAKDFIDQVESLELGRMIDCKALELGLNALRRVPSLRLSINMSARSIGYGPWREILDAGLRRDPSVAERLILEITERSAMLMPEIVQTFMADLQEMGIAFALDDFGAGYTAFRYLRDFYFDILKIDGSYIRGIHQNPDNLALSRALIALARHFDMFTVAESVENAKDAECLEKAGIDCMQGYHFGVPTVRPLWLVEAEERLSA